MTLSAPAEPSFEILRSNGSRGTCQWKLSNINALRIEEWVESDPFELAGYFWILVAMLVSRSSNGPTVVKIMCVSFNSDPVHAHIQLKAGNSASTATNIAGRIPSTACPFGWIYKGDVFLRDSQRNPDTQTRSPNDNLLVVMDFKHVRKAKKKDQQGKGSDITKMMFLEVIDQMSIERYFNGNTYGVASQRPDPNLTVHQHSLARYWGKQLLEERYWWYQRNGGNLKVKKCLSDLGPFKTLFDLRIDGQTPGVFKEHKPESGEFEQTSPGTQLFFVRFIEPGYEDPSSYGGHLLVRNTDIVPDLLYMAVDMVHPRDGNLKAFIELDGSYTDITDIQMAVGECDCLQKSSVIALSPCPKTVCQR